MNVCFAKHCPLVLGFALAGSIWLSGCLDSVAEAQLGMVYQAAFPLVGPTGYGQSFGNLSVTRFGFSHHRHGHKGLHLDFPLHPKHAKHCRAHGYGVLYGYGYLPGIYPGYGLSPYQTYAYRPYGDLVAPGQLLYEQAGIPLSRSSIGSADRLSTTRDALASLDSIRPAFVTTNRLAMTYQRRAERAFRMGRYTDAARLANEALLVDGTNGLLMLFSAQANFAAGYYEQAVNELESATSLLAIEQWDFIARNSFEFYEQDNFVEQLNGLSARIDASPRDTNALILRGFQFAAAGSPAIASNDFNAALLIDSNNELALRLLRGMTGTEAPLQIWSPSEPLPIEIISPELAPETVPDDAPNFQAPSDPENPLRAAPVLESSTFDGPPIDGPDGTE